MHLSPAPCIAHPYDSRGYRDWRVRQGLDHGPDAPPAWFVAVVVLLAIAAVVLALSGCALGASHAAPDLAASLGSAGDAGGLPGAVAAARAAGGPLVASTAAALRSASALNLLGGAALLAGFVYGCVPALPTGAGVGLALGGAACLLAGVLLPLVSGWVGLALLGLAGLAALAHHFPSLNPARLLKPSPVTP